ncbi:MAG: hypothetical protein AAFV30_09990 [Pseudomonadota bacterium]
MSTVDRMGQAARFALLASGTLAILVSLYFASCDWIANPGGIFRSEAGTNWTFVWDTWLSWFLPTLIGLMPPAFLAHIGWQWIKSDA